jgi:predicted alpha/beta-hydrolase family hydrolase
VLAASAVALLQHTGKVRYSPQPWSITRAGLQAVTVILNHGAGAAKGWCIVQRGAAHHTQQEQQWTQPGAKAVALFPPRWKQKRREGLLTVMDLTQVKGIGCCADAHVAADTAGRLPGGRGKGTP